MLSLPESIRSSGLGCLSTSDDKGNPSGATLFYTIKGNKLYCLTHAKSLKVAHIKNNPKVCFVIVNEPEYDQAQLYATASVIDDFQEYFPILEEIGAEYTRKIRGQSPFTEIRNQGELVVLELTPNKVKIFQSGKGLSTQSVSEKH